MGSLEQYRARIPAHAHLSDDVVRVALADAVAVHAGPNVWGGAYTLAMVFYAAHLLERTPGVGSALADAAGPVTSKKDGDLAVSYGAPTGDALLETTVYGQRYLELRRSRVATAPRGVRLA